MGGNSQHGMEFSAISLRGLITIYCTSENQERRFSSQKKKKKKNRGVGKSAGRGKKKKRIFASPIIKKKHTIY